ncbi:hypothetical protein HHX47_DHR1000699 [Lentinula edodes]|nr:hypothetical protein HHX47_DHR1000699 [Lentinula edodes]
MCARGLSAHKHSCDSPFKLASIRFSSTRSSIQLYILYILAPGYCKEDITLCTVGNPYLEMTDLQIHESYQRLLKNEDAQGQKLSTPLAAILALTEMMKQSNAGTMFELLNELKGAAEALSKHSSNPIGLNAGCELFIEFITLFPHDAASFSELKTELIRQGQQYAEEALAYRTKIAELAFDFIKDDSVSGSTNSAHGS